MGKVTGPTGRNFPLGNLYESFNHFENMEYRFWAILLQIKTKLARMLERVKKLVILLKNLGLFFKVT